MQPAPGLRQTIDNSCRLCESLQTSSAQISGRTSQANVSAESKNTTTSNQIFPWKVIHACEQVRDVLPVVESQLAVGMRPFLVTPTGFGSALNYLRRPMNEKPQAASLLRAWSDVLNWKRLLVEGDSHNDAEIIHAHSFAAGMAAVRSNAAVVYDMRQAVEQIAAEERTWLRRSFQAAEQFVLSRAGGVVVHSNELRQECLRRGVEEQSLFCVPQPLDSGWLDSLPDRYWIERRTGANPHTTIFFAPELGRNGTNLDQELSKLVEALNFVLGENDNVMLVLLSDGDAERIPRRLQTEKVGNVVQVLPKTERDRAVASSDVIILCDTLDHEFESSSFVEALARGRALLAPDKQSLRELAPAASCLWFQARKEQDLAHRMAFLARNPDVCRIIARNGRRYVESTRSPQAIGERYDEVYKQVAAKTRQSSTKSNDVRLVPLHVNL
jgi:glycosyltransferase involved in cell wall biosynthesis